MDIKKKERKKINMMIFKFFYEHINKGQTELRDPQQRCIVF